MTESSPAGSRAEPFHRITPPYPPIPTSLRTTSEVAALRRRFPALYKIQ